MPAVIAENDESQWEDETGVLYHFPKRYRATLVPGEPVVYYKGKLRDERFSARRLSPEPHYFGVAFIGKVYPDRSSSKGDLFATLEGYRSFTEPVPLRTPLGSYFEQIPITRATNYWRDGVRAVSQEVYDAIVGATKLADAASPLDAPSSSVAGIDEELESHEEGQPTRRYVSTYERNPVLRRQAIAIHGCTCVACGVNMGVRYGKIAEGLIHVHHVVPVSTFGGSRKVDPETDLVPVCPNCHAVIHRRKDRTLTVAEVRELVKHTGMELA